MRLRAALAAFTLGFFAGCAFAPKTARRPASPVKQADPVLLNRLFAQAVFAYRKGDLKDARWYVRDILSLDPRHSDALALRTRLDAIERLKSAQ
ncbi:MAG: hypothetical protein HY553_16095 [Elusimicrobia bacterium]|nr:hypothetical protein [Elusimicrobiota bacterium]